MRGGRCAAPGRARCWRCCRVRVGCARPRAAGDPSAAGSPEASSGSSGSAPAVPCAVDGFAPDRAGRRTPGDAGGRLRAAAAARAGQARPGAGDAAPAGRPAPRACVRPTAADVDPAVLRRVAAALPGGSTGPLSETFATEVTVGRSAPRPRRLVAYAVDPGPPLRLDRRGLRPADAPPTARPPRSSARGCSWVGSQRLDRLRRGWSGAAARRTAACPPADRALLSVPATRPASRPGSHGAWPDSGTMPR